MHGRDAVLEEILDWRPYDYVTDRTTLQTPGGPVKLLHTVLLEPTADGTVVHLRFGLPRTARDREALSDIPTAYAAALCESAPKLIAGLEAALAAHVAGAEPEPALAAPKPDGVLASLPPLLIVG